ncbi:MAG: bifunctional phosphopantothenoylcysteine decarboxylase/phosphopantothenate--cysteine ligase CoaBC [bacterium]
MFSAKKITVGVTGSIAAYKACELVRELRRQRAEVRIVMTEAATKFVAPLTFATLSENPVLHSLFDSGTSEGILHIDLARWSDTIVVCPATANVIGKVAAGLADDPLSTSILAARVPVVFCPAMNTAMWENAVVQENVARLKARGHAFVDPEKGPLATRSEGEGWGRLATLENIVQQLKYILLGTQELAGKKVVVTAGPTREPLDPVRFLSNRSTGKMGFALAAAARLRGAEAVLVSGPTHLTAPQGIDFVAVNTAEEMYQAVERVYARADILIMSAAVSDYRPTRHASHKLKKEDQEMVLNLKKTKDILKSLARKKGPRLHVGFAVETVNELANAQKKLYAKDLDMIVLNNPLEDGAGFGWDTNKVTILYANGDQERLPKMSKSAVAQKILDGVCNLLHKNEEKACAN